MSAPQEQELLAQKEFLLNGTPVARLTGNEFAPKSGTTLTQQVVEYYNSIGNVAISPAYGEVILDKKGVDDDLAHGMGRVKAIAFAAVPKIIERGMVILPFGLYKEGERVLSAMVAAPISIAEREHIGVVVLRKRQDINKLYVHEVFLKEKLLVGQGVKELLKGGSNPTLSLATNQGAITKVLQNIISAKSASPDLRKQLRPMARGMKKRGRGLGL